jgi:hypothetical protein
MKSFQQYLKEEVAWLRSTSKMVFDFGEISQMKIPLTSKTMTWIFNVQLPCYKWNWFGEFEKITE